MSLRTYLNTRACDYSLAYTQRNYCRELISNKSIPLDSENADLIQSAVEKCYPMNSGIQVFTQCMLFAYQNESRKKDQAANRAANYLDILRDVFDRCDCYHDDGRTREQFRQRPELHLMAVIASGLFEIADAIRSTREP